MDNLRDKILASHDLKVEKIYVKEWKQTVYLREFSMADRMSIENITKEASQDSFIKVLVLGVCDKEGNKIFTNEDVEALKQKNAKPIQRLFLKVMKLNKLNDSDIEEDVKNLEGPLQE